MTAFVVRPDLFGSQAQPVGRVVLAAVSHHKDFEVTGQHACRPPIWLVQIPGEGPALKTPIFLQLTDEIPPIIAYPLEEGLRGIP
jgi:hypothetical protein